MSIHLTSRPFIIHSNPWKFSQREIQESWPKSNSHANPISLPANVSPRKFDLRNSIYGSRRLLFILDSLYTRVILFIYTYIHTYTLSSQSLFSVIYCNNSKYNYFIVLSVQFIRFPGSKLCFIVTDNCAGLFFFFRGGVILVTPAGFVWYGSCGITQMHFVRSLLYLQAITVTNMVNWMFCAIN